MWGEGRSWSDNNPVRFDRHSRCVPAPAIHSREVSAYVTSCCLSTPGLQPSRLPAYDVQMCQVHSYRRALVLAVLSSWNTVPPELCIADFLTSWSVLKCNPLREAFPWPPYPTSRPLPGHGTPPLFHMLGSSEANTEMEYGVLWGAELNQREKINCDTFPTKPGLTQ